MGSPLGGGATGPTGSTGGVKAWAGYPTGPTGATGAPKRKPLCGAVYGPQDALDLLNSHYLIGKSEQEVAIFRIRDDGLLTFTPPEQFKLDVANIFVQPSARSGRSIPVEKFWKESPFRHQRVIVFKPTGAIKASEFNLWRGFAVEPREGWQQIRRLLRHILKVICRRRQGEIQISPSMAGMGCAKSRQASRSRYCTQKPQAGHGQEHARRRYAENLWTARCAH